MSEAVEMSTASANTSAAEDSFCLRDNDPSRWFAERLDEAANNVWNNASTEGQIYRDLAKFLVKPYTLRAGDRNAARHDANGNTFVTLHEMYTDRRKPAQHFDTVSGFLDATSAYPPSEPYGHILFMRGYPSPEWLNAIGSKFDLNFGFFNRHLDFRIGKPDHFIFPTLPSASELQPQLITTTIVARMIELDWRKTSPNALQTLRKVNDDRMQYLSDALQRGEDKRTQTRLPVAESIVRSAATHDENHVSFEQQISIHISAQGQGWTAVVWLDHGEDLGSSTLSAWLAAPLDEVSVRTTVLPVVQHQELAPENSDRVTSASSSMFEKPKVPQSASCLYSHYGTGLDPRVACRDSFYALSGLFIFAASSELQLLNLLEDKISKAVASSDMAEVQYRNLSMEHVRYRNLSNLSYTKQILDRHISRLEATMRSLDPFEMQRWPRLDAPEANMNENEIHRVASTSAARLHRDYEFLLTYACKLATRCEDGMQLNMQYVMLKESQKAIEQASGVSRLTRLAFVYIPLSFTSAFFGMNFRELGQGSRSIWIWFAVSIPVFILSVLSMRADILRRICACWRKIHHSWDRFWHRNRPMVVSRHV